MNLQCNPARRSLSLIPYISKATGFVYVMAALYSLTLLGPFIFNWWHSWLWWLPWLTPRNLRICQRTVRTIEHLRSMGVVLPSSLLQASLLFCACWHGRSKRRVPKSWNEAWTITRSYYLWSGKTSVAEITWKLTPRPGLVLAAYLSIDDKLSALIIVSGTRYGLGKHMVKTGPPDAIRLGRTLCPGSNISRVHRRN